VKSGKNRNFQIVSVDCHFFRHLLNIW